MLWSCLPAGIALLLLVVYLVPKHISGLGNVMPLLPIIPVYFWGTGYSREMPYWFVFLLGFLVDTATGQPVGISSLSYVCFLAVLHGQRKYIHKEGFVIRWAYFALLFAAMLFLQWLLLWLVYSTLYPLRLALIQWLLTVCIYPLLHMGFSLLAERVHHKRWRLEHVR